MSDSARQFAPDSANPPSGDAWLTFLGAFFQDNQGAQRDRASRIETKIDTLSERVDHLETSVTGLKAGQGQLQATVAELKTGQAHLRTAVAELKTGQGQLQTAIVDLQTGQARPASRRSGRAPVVIKD